MERSGSVAFEIRVCQDGACGLRYPVFGEDLSTRDGCPRCGMPVVVVHTHRPQPPIGNDTASHARDLAETDVGRFCGVLDNLRSAFNVGSILRAADGAGMAELHLCGYTPTPEQSKVAKTALGAQHSVPWFYHPNALETVESLQARGWRVAALETTGDALSIFAADHIMPADTRLALVVGNEVVGVDPAIVARADWVFRIPMAGSKGSLNVAVAFGVAAFWFSARLFQSGPHEMSASQPGSTR